jgi:UDP-N-acetylglucosamine enolpyruvyl transferase
MQALSLFCSCVKGDITVKNVEYPFLELLLKKLEDSGANFEIIKKKGDLVVC